MPNPVLWDQTRRALRQVHSFPLDSALVRAALAKAVHRIVDATELAEVPGAGREDDSPGAVSAAVDADVMFDIPDDSAGRIDNTPQPVAHEDEAAATHRGKCCCGKGRCGACRDGNC